MKIKLYEKVEPQLTEGEITKGPFEVKIYYDYTKRKYRAEADDGIHGSANCRFPNDLRNKDCIYIVSQLDWLGDQYNVPAKVIIGEKTDMELEADGVTFNDDGTATFPPDYFAPSSLKEAFENNAKFVPDSISYELGDSKFSADDISPYTLRMIQEPLKKNGQPWAETVAILKIYDHLVNKGERYVSRETILRESGVANWNRQGEHSTWFTEFKILGLIILSDNDILKGPNLEGWVEGTVYPTGFWNKRDGTQVPIGPGNPKGIDLRPFVNIEVETRPDQWIQPDRSHGKGDTKTAGTDLHSSGVTFNDDGTATFPPDYFAPSSLRENMNLGEPDKIMSPLDIQVNNSKKKINQLYRQYMSLQEDAEVNEDSINDWGVRHIAARHGWDEDCIRKALLGR